MAEICLDVSELEPCEPLERALLAVSVLQSGDWLRMLHRREPFPLYQMLKKQGVCWHTRAGFSSAYEVFIWHCGDVAAESAIQRLRED